MSEKDITPFNFGNQAIRAVNIDGEAWFVAKDVVEAVEAAWKGKQAVQHVPEQWRGVTSIVTPSGIHEMAILAEQGVYFYLSRSDKPKALPIQMWISGEVLPSIRKTGAYSVAQTPAQKIDAIQAMLDVIRETEARVTKVEHAVAALGAHEDYLTIKAYAAHIGAKLKGTMSADLGRLATSLSRQAKVKTGTQVDETYGHVNTYHRDILERVFQKKD